MRRIAALLTCHNRCAETLACLKSLHSCILPAGVVLDTIVVDDGSTDGTTEAVRELYPAAKLIKGNGRLYWNGGMRLAMEEAALGQYDFILWLNDDVLLDPAAIENLLETHEQVSESGAVDVIVAGSTCDSGRRQVTYGGQMKARGIRRRRLVLLNPGQQPTQVATMNGNCVLIPTTVTQKLGNLDPDFSHGLGDFDYGLRASRAGIKVVVCPGYVGICRRDARPELPDDLRCSIRAQLARVSDDKNLPYGAWFTYTRRHSPRLWMVNWPRPYVGAVSKAILWKLRRLRSTYHTVADAHHEMYPPRTSTTGRVLFVFDRVAHYHRALFGSLESELPAHGLQLYLLSGRDSPRGKGRVGLSRPVVANETKYRFFEYSVGGLVLRFNRGVGRAIRDIRPDIVVVPSHVGNLSTWRLAAKKKSVGYRLVAWQCGYEYHPSKIKDLLLRRYMRSFDYHLAYHTNARGYAGRYGVPDSHITVIHNTIDERQIVTQPKSLAKAVLARLHPETADRRIVLFVGAVLAEKRVEVIVQALELLSRSDLVLLVVGDGDHLERLRATCKARTDVIFAGEVLDDVGTYFDGADVYVLPGTGGLGINEAMAHGLPVISGFADGSADDLVIDGENGFRLKQGTPEEVAWSIAAILDDPGLAKRMGERSAELIKGPFAFESFVSRVVTSLVSITKGESRS